MDPTGLVCGVINNRDTKIKDAEPPCELKRTATSAMPAQEHTGARALAEGSHTWGGVAASYKTRAKLSGSAQAALYAPVMSRGCTLRSNYEQRTPRPTNLMPVRRHRKLDAMHGTATEFVELESEVTERAPLTSQASVGRILV